jgi:hypothetical protein
MDGKQRPEPTNDEPRQGLPPEAPMIASLILLGILQPAEGFLGCYRTHLDYRGSLNGGGRGIRTPVTLSGKAVFKTACFNRSHIPPREQQCSL